MTSSSCTCQSREVFSQSSSQGCSSGSSFNSHLFPTISPTSSSSSSSARTRVTMFSHNRIFFSLLVFASVIAVISASYGPFADIEGDYCRKRIGGCCSGRQDECSAPILGTLCYCDYFCNRTDNPDCCPDFRTFCLNETPPPDDILERKECFHGGKYFAYGSTTKINCNQCKCETSPSDPSKYEFLCERDDCMIDSSLIETINDGDYDWKARNYSDFWGRKLSDGILYRLGTLEPERAVKNMEPIKYVYDVSTLPQNFDSRQNWPGMIQSIRDQRWCGSDWAMTTTAVTADRLAIQSKGEEKDVMMSVQHLISCIRRSRSQEEQGCTGGHLDRSWNFMRRLGVVDEECYPYESGLTGTSGNCLISVRVKSFLDVKQCQRSNSLNGRKELYKSQPAYRISPNENDIKYEIMTFGPVQAVMSVPGDFFMYHNGVYRKSGLRPEKRMGYHSVRIIGWGEEFIQGRFVKYWLVANTWGREWGEDGYFKILRGENECEIETFVIAAWARPANPYSKASNNYKF